MSETASPKSSSETVIPSWRVPLEFAIHAIIGSAIFGIIAMAALGVNLGVVKLEAYGTDKVIVLGLKAAEYAIFGVDLVLFFVFLFRTALRTVKRL